MLIDFNTSSMDDYQKFLKLKRIPSYSWKGMSAVVPNEYAGMLVDHHVSLSRTEYEASEFLFDYQRDIARLAIQKQKFAVFARCGLGKTLIMLEFARHASRYGKTLIVSPLMVVDQTINEAFRFYGDIQITSVPAAKLNSWINTKSDEIGVTNYEAIRDGLHRGYLSALILDESSMLKSHYGAWGNRLIDIGRGLNWKLCLTGTPAPNDRHEYANHAVFLDNKRTVNEFLARYFVNRGETQNRWEIMPHAIGPFYRDMSHWCIFLNNPATYGWKDNCDTIPPVNVHIERVELTQSQRIAARSITGGLFVKEIGGIGQRGKLSQIAKGNGAESNKPAFIRDLVNSWPDESTIIWCRYNDEQESMERMFPDAVSVSGSTSVDQRIDGIDAFKRGEKRVLISKPKILGFGLNLQIATRQVWSGLQDSYEEFHQGVSRSNRIGSTRPLNVHIPVTELEEPMISNVLQKAHRVQQDTEQQEAIFKQYRLTL